jgi:hypothetical protein
MPIKKLSPVEVKTLQDTLVLARVGKASMTQLATAHDLANAASLNGCLGEIRQHIRGIVQPPAYHAAGKNVALGVVSGILTHMLLGRE